MYAADELLTQPDVQVNVFDRLPVPYGLVRAGVAPDHQKTKQVTRLFDKIAAQKGFEFYLNVEIGKHISHSELLEITMRCSTQSALRPTVVSAFRALICLARPRPPTS